MIVQIQQKHFCDFHVIFVHTFLWENENFIFAHRKQVTYKGCYIWIMRTHCSTLNFIWNIWCAVHPSHPMVNSFIIRWKMFWITSYIKYMVETVGFSMMFYDRDSFLWDSNSHVSACVLVLFIFDAENIRNHLNESLWLYFTVTFIWCLHS